MVMAELRKRREFDIQYNVEKGKIVIYDPKEEAEYTVAIELVFSKILRMQVGEAVLEKCVGTTGE